MAQFGEERVVVVANKWWEASPLVNVLLHPQARPEALTNFWISQTMQPKGDGGPPAPGPRISFRCHNRRVEIWCLQDLMSPDPKLQSSSWQKAKVLPGIASGFPPPSVIIAFGTAAAGDFNGRNGCAVIGSTVFVHDYEDPDPNSGCAPEHRWENKSFDEPVLSQVCGTLDSLSKDFIPFTKERFLDPPLEPSCDRTVYVGNEQVSVGVVNVAETSCYDRSDPEALKRFKESSGARGVASSLETTHGVIRLTFPKVGFLFVSGIVNDTGEFESQVAPRLYSQNFVGAHNAGVALAWALPGIVEAL